MAIDFVGTRQKSINRPSLLFLSAEHNTGVTGHSLTTSTSAASLDPFQGPAGHGRAGVGGGGGGLRGGGRRFAICVEHRQHHQEHRGSDGGANVGSWPPGHGTLPDDLALGLLLQEGSGRGGRSDSWTTSSNSDNIINNISSSNSSGAYSAFDNGNASNAANTNTNTAIAYASYSTAITTNNSSGSTGSAAGLSRYERAGYLTGNSGVRGTWRFASCFFSLTLSQR